MSRDSEEATSSLPRRKFKSERGRYSPRGLPVGVFTLENRSGYRTADLHAFFHAGLRACGVDKPIHLAVVPSPIRSRGCAEVGGARMVIAIASPSRFDRRRLARVFIHECAHLRGVDHAAMPHDLLYSLGPTPAWARDLPLRHTGRAPPQLKLLG